MTGAEGEGPRGEDARPPSLIECDEGEDCRVVSLPEESECARKLLPLAILPGSEICLVEKPPFGAVMVERGGDRIALSRRLACDISVEQI